MMTSSMMNAIEYIGKSVVFIESGEMCLATVVSANYDAVGFKATFEASLSPALSYKFWQQQESLADPWSGEFPFGQCWDVSVSKKEFFFDADHWQASFLWGGGFRVFLNQLFVERFINHDVDWLEEFYNCDEDDYAEDE
jgi:hypothetical protein